jgi:hypothetical protein
LAWASGIRFFACSVHFTSMYHMLSSVEACLNSLLICAWVSRVSFTDVVS